MKNRLNNNQAKERLNGTYNGYIIKNILLFFIKVQLEGELYKEKYRVSLKIDDITREIIKKI